MAKPFRELLAKAGYRTQRADNPAYEREIDPDPVEISSSSNAVGDTNSALVQDMLNGRLVTGPYGGEAVNDIRTEPQPIEGFVENPFITPNEEYNPDTALEATRRRRLQLPLEEEEINPLT